MQRGPTQLNLTYDHTFRSMKAIFDGIKGGIPHSSQIQGSRLWRQLNQEILGKPLDQITMRKVAFVSAMMTTPFFALFGWTWF
jgi:hypothetical protein